MKPLLRRAVWWETVKSGVWTVPLAMLPLAVLLHRAAIELDALGIDRETLLAWGLYSGSGDDARNLLSTLVTAIITMSSLVFSITVVTLSLASNQFGSRIVMTHLNDVRTKLALGTFTATVVYCLLALRSVHQAMAPSAVPHVTVSLGLLLGLVGVISLLLFLHVVARSIVADQVVRRVAEELEAQIEQLPPLPEGDDGRDDDEAGPAVQRPAGRRLLSREEGHVQAVDYEAIADIASRHDVRVRLDFKPGVFMCRDGWLGWVEPAPRATPALERAIGEKIVIGNRRTATQDLEYSIRHLVDIALRALSPGINDTNTALVVIDRLRGALARLLGKRLRVVLRHPQGWRVRLAQDLHEDIIASSFDQIRQSASRNPAALIRLLEALARLAEHLRTAAQRDALLRQADMTVEAARETTRLDDHADVEAAYRRARASIEHWTAEGSSSAAAGGTVPGRGR